MSPLGKWLLENCDNNLQIDLNSLLPGMANFARRGQAIVVALHLGLSVKVGS